MKDEENGMVAEKYEKQIFFNYTDTKIQELRKHNAETTHHYLITRFKEQPDQVLPNYFGQVKSATTTANLYDRRVEVELLHSYSVKSLPEPQQGLFGSK